jgi:hypothetical protein
MRLTGGAAWLDLKRRFMSNPFDFLKLGSGEADGDIVRADLVISKLSSRMDKHMVGAPAQGTSKGP